MAEKTYPDYGEMERHWNDKVDEIHLAPMPPTVAEPTTKDELVRDLLAMGVRGRHVMVHSSYKLLAPVENGPQAVVNACLEAVGPDGCLIFPTYDFESFTERGYWDHANTPSRMGIISELARKDGRFFRSRHPVLSYVVAGTHYSGARMLAGLDRPVAHGSRSAFSEFVDEGGLLISIGADKQSGFRNNDVGFTISNHAAVLAGAPWRKMKVFEGVVPDMGICRYALSVNADPSRYVTEVTPGHLEAEKQGIIKRFPIGRTEAWVAYARTFVDWAVESHKTDPALWRKQFVQPSESIDVTDTETKNRKCEYCGASAVRTFAVGGGGIHDACGACWVRG